MTPLATVVNKIVYDILKQQHPLLPELVMFWDKIVGVDLSHSSGPLKVVRNCELKKKNNINTLYIAVDNNTVASKLAYQTDIIIERISIYFGYQAIHNIKLLSR